MPAVGELSKDQCKTGHPTELTYTPGCISSEKESKRCFGKGIHSKKILRHVDSGDIFDGE